MRKLLIFLSLLACTSSVYATTTRTGSIVIDDAFSGTTIATEVIQEDQYFTEDEVVEIAIVEMVATLIFWVIAFGLNLKNII